MRVSLRQEASTEFHLIALSVSILHGTVSVRLSISHTTWHAPHQSYQHWTNVTVYSKLQPRAAPVFASRSLKLRGREMFPRCRSSFVELSACLLQAYYIMYAFDWTVKRIVLPSGVDLVRKVGGRGMVGADASWSVCDKVYIYIHRPTYILVSVLNKPSQYRTVPQFWEWGTKQCCERSEQKIFGFLPQIVTFLRYISRKWSQKNCRIYLFWRQKGSSCPLLARCLAKSGRTNYITVPPPEILGDSSPLSSVIYATGITSAHHGYHFIRYKNSPDLHELYWCHRPGLGSGSPSPQPSAAIVHHYLLHESIV